MQKIKKSGGNPKAVAIVCAAIGTIATAVHAGTCTINVGDNSQTIDGFGFSSAWCGTLSTAKNAALYDTLGMSLLRVRIDEGGSWGEESANASAAHSRGLKVLASEWSPPPQWNSNGKSTGGSLLTSHYGDYANWLHNAGTTIGVDYISFQNEPDIGSGSVAWTPTQMETFVDNNSSAIGKAIAMPESFHFDDNYSDPTLNDSVGVNKITIVAGHIYGSGLSVHQNALNHGKHVWMTEHYISDTQTSMANCIQIAKEISDCMNDQMSAYFWWWVNDSDTSVNLVNTSGTIFKNGYTIGQFAKYVRPGKLRCSTTYNPTSNVYVTAYHSGGIVIVAVNTGTSSVSQAFTIQNATGVTSFLVNRTSSSENISGVTTANVSNNTFTYTLPAQSVTTFHQF